MTVLVFGSDGPLDAVLAQVPGVVVLSSQIADPRRPADCADVVHDVAPTAVLYLATCRDADRAVSDPGYVQALNAGSSQAVAEACAQLDIPLVFHSSADVFDGTLPMAYVPSDRPDPVTALGHGLWAGETGIRSTLARHAIVRSTWVFGDDPMAALAEPGIQVAGPTTWRAADGVVAAPTPAFDLASAMLTIAAALVGHRDKAGTFHFAGDQYIALAGYAQRLALRLSGSAPQIETVPASDLWGYPRVIENARLDCRTTQAVFGLKRPDWRTVMRGTLIAPRQGDRQVA